jgi:hypothetical protein
VRVQTCPFVQTGQLFVEKLVANYPGIGIVAARHEDSKLMLRGTQLTTTRTYQFLREDNFFVIPIIC